jgi:hypothetical protein
MARARGYIQGLAYSNVLEIIRPVTPASGYRTVAVAQLAVALGAADPLLAEMTAHPEGLPQVGPVVTALWRA